MKKTFLFLLLFTGMVNAQILTIPDANFKAKLLAADTSNTIAYGGGGYMKIDANSDGEIQLIEAQAVDSLDVNYGTIADLNGILNFSNLKKLECNGNQLTSLDVTPLVNLKKLECYLNRLTSLNLQGLANLTFLDCIYNKLTSLDVSGLVNLTSLDCGYNQLTSLDVTPLVNLTSLRCNDNQLTSLNVSGLVNLTSLDCYYNELTSLDVSGLVNLTSLYCYSNQLTLLDVTSLVNLTSLSCDSNQLTSLDVTPLVNLSEFNCSFNQLTSLDVTPLVNLEYLNCGSNQLTLLDVTSLGNLTNLYCDSNQLTSLDVTPLVNLTTLSCRNNQLTSLDVTNQINLQYLDCGFNNLTNLFIKNTNSTGGDGDSFEFSQNPNLQYICANENQLIYVINKINEYGYTNCHVNTYCSFVPGGAYNTIKGNIKLDSDNNGCDANDINTTALKIKINDGITDGSTLINAAGDYTFYTEAGSFTLTPQLENPAYFTVSPTNPVVTFPTVTSETKLQDFCISANGVHPDLEVVIAPITRARPGFDATYEIVYKNKGNQTLSGTVNLTFDDAILDLVTANPVVTNQNTDNLSWDYTNLLPFETRVIEVTLNVNSPLETPAVNIEDILNFTTSITPVAGDELPLDNQFVYNQTVVGSYDPNDITCLEGDMIPPSEIGNYLHYIVNFENTGNYEAENVVVAITVDTTKYDIDSLQLLQASNDVDARITGNKVEFIFKKIKLKSTPVGGHGNVLFKIESLETLVTNDKVDKMANIFFDYNAPVSTNTAETTYATLSNAGFHLDESVAIYPNPASAKINVKANTDIKTINLYDLQGRIIETAIGNNTFLDISNQQNGVYFLKVTTEKGSKVEKVIKN